MRPFFLVVLLFAGTVAIAGASAWADQPIKNLKKPIPIELSTTLDTQAMKEGDLFEGVLMETQTYRQQSIPQGTLFKGHVSKTKPSKRYARAGFFELNVDEAILPSGETYTFDKEKFETRTKKYHHKKGITVKRLLTNSLPMFAASAGTSMPLHFATNLSGGLLFPIALGARSATAMVLESAKRDGRGVGELAAFSVFRGSGGLAAYNFFRVSQSPNFKEGQQIGLYMDPEWVKGLLQANDDIQLLNSTTR